MMVGLSLFPSHTQMSEEVTPHRKWLTAVKDRIRAVLQRLSAGEGSYRIGPGGDPCTMHDAVTLESEHERNFMISLLDYHSYLQPISTSWPSYRITFSRDGSMSWYHSIETSDTAMNIDALISCIDKLFVDMWTNVCSDYPHERAGMYTTTKRYTFEMAITFTELELLVCCVHAYLLSEYDPVTACNGPEHICTHAPWILNREYVKFYPVIDDDHVLFSKFCPHHRHHPR